MILLIDNYDSFVYNLSRYIKELGYETLVVRNDAITIDTINNEINPSHIILSPGPCTPDEAGICLDIIRAFGQQVPILGVCLGHQAIAQAFGARIVKAGLPMHGRASQIWHDREGVFSQLTSPLSVARYHSLIVDPDSITSDFKVTAYSKEQEIMAIRHRVYPLVGVQFHPESVLTASGHQMLHNFLSL